VSWQAKFSERGPRRKVVRWLSFDTRDTRIRNPHQKWRGVGTALLECGHEVHSSYLTARYHKPAQSKKCPKCADAGVPWHR
jgi:hypothetical protein